MRTPSIARAALLVAAFTVAARAVGFLRVLVFAHTVGPTCLGDTYYTANTVPNIVFDVVAGGALASVVVPLLADPVRTRDHARADRIASGLLTWCLLLLVPVALAGLFLAGPAMAALVGNGRPGCSATQEQLVGARMLRVFLPQIPLYGVGIVLTGIVQTHRRFLAPAIGPLASSVVVIGAYLWYAAVATDREGNLSTLSRQHELILSVGTTLGVVALVLPLFWPTHRAGRRLRPTLRLPAGVGATARRMAIAGAVVLASQDLATAVILRLANDRGAPGSVVLYTLAWSVFTLPWAVLAVPLATAAFPTLSEQWQRGHTGAYARTASDTARIVVLTAAGAAAVLVAISAPAARVVVLGAPGGVAPVDLARALVAFAPGLVGFAVMAHLSRVHYARGDARTPALATAVAWAVCVVVDVVGVLALPRSWTATGLGIGSSIGMSLGGIWLALALRRHAGHGAVRRLGSTLTASVLAAVLAGGVAWVAVGRFPPSGIAASVALSMLGAIVGAGLFLVLTRRLDATTVALLRSRLGALR